MSWYDIMIDGVRSDREIAEAVARAFDIQPAEVLVREELQDLPTLDTSIRVLCERFARAPGDFPLQLGVIPQDPTILQCIERDEVQTLRRVCAALDANCLLADPDSLDPNPYVSLYVPLEGPPRRVYLDAERLDREDAYVIVSDAPTVAELA